MESVNPFDCIHNALYTVTKRLPIGYTSNLRSREMLICREIFAHESVRLGFKPENIGKELKKSPKSTYYYIHQYKLDYKQSADFRKKADEIRDLIDKNTRKYNLSLEEIVEELKNIGYCYTDSLRWSINDINLVAEQNEIDITHLTKEDKLAILDEILSERQAFQEEINAEILDKLQEED